MEVKGIPDGDLCFMHTACHCLVDIEESLMLPK